MACVAPCTEGRRHVGFTVSRRVGGAVVRNRVKRWLREAVRRQKAALPEGTDLVLIARPAAAGAGYEAIFRDVGAVLGQLAPGGRPAPGSGSERRRRRSARPRSRSRGSGGAGSP